MKDLNTIVELAKKHSAIVSKVGDDFIHVICTSEGQRSNMRDEAIKLKIISKHISGFSNDALILMYFMRYA